MRVIAALFLVVVGGCGSQEHWRWSSERGRHCWTGCMSERRSCASICGTRADLVTRDEKARMVMCRRSCDDAEHTCMQRCPDLQHVNRRGDEVVLAAPGQLLVSDWDCWQLEGCKPQNCTLQHGRCLKW